MPTQEQDRESAEELTLYAINTAELYPEYIRIVGHMKRRIYNGTTKGMWRLWTSWFQDAAIRYRDEIDVDTRFSGGAINVAAFELSAYTHYQILNGEFDGQYGTKMLNKDGTVHELADHSFKIDSPGDWVVARGEEVVFNGRTEVESRHWLETYAKNHKPEYSAQLVVRQIPEVWAR